MSNESLLLVHDEATPVAAVPSPACVLRTGYNMVPPFWLACFRTSDLASVAIPVQDSSGRPASLTLDMLMAPRSTAIDRLRAFQAALRSCPRIFADAEPVLLALAASLEKARGKSVQLYDVEIQMMVGPEENRPWLASCLAFVEDIASSKVAGEDILQAPQALELFDQAQITVPEWTAELDWEECLIGVSV